MHGLFDGQSIEEGRSLNIQPMSNRLRDVHLLSQLPQQRRRSGCLHKLLVLHVAHGTPPSPLHGLHTHFTLADALVPTREARSGGGAVEADHTLGDSLSRPDSVGSEVPDQISFLCSSVVAVGAGKGLLASVGSEMVCQNALHRSPVVAMSAGKRPIAGVGSDMGCQKRFRCSRKAILWRKPFINGWNPG